MLINEFYFSLDRVNMNLIKGKVDINKFILTSDIAKCLGVLEDGDADFKNVPASTFHKCYLAKQAM